MSNVSTVLNNESVVTAKAEGFNQGMQLAAQKFSLYIYLLAALYGLKIVLKLPPIQNRMDGYLVDAAETVGFGADVLAFFIVVVLVFAVSGRNILGV